MGGQARHLTKHNKKLLRLQREWRAEEARRQARREDEDDDLDFGVEAGGITVSDEDDDFY